MLLTADQVRSTLDPDQRAALAAIVEAEEVWSSVTALALAGVGPATVDGLVALELAVRWQPAVGAALVEDLVTLSAWGAFVLAAEIDERTEVDDGDALEVPYWVRKAVAPGEEAGTPSWVSLGVGSDRVYLPRYARGCRLPFPERVADRESVPDPVVPDYLLDEWTGEPVIMWGRPVPMERRSKRRRRATA